MRSKNVKVKRQNQNSKVKSFEFLIVVLTFSFLLLTFASSAFAAIEVEPLRLELEADAGKTASGYITLTNRAAEPAEISLSPGEYRYMFTDNTIFPTGVKTPALTSCRAWISFKPDKLKLEKNKAQQVQYTINIPAAQTSESVASILIDEERKESALKPGEAGQVIINITPRISIPIYVAIKSALKRSCIIADLTAAASKDKNSVEISITLKNTGAAHIRPTTTLVILDEDGAVSKKIALGKSLPVFAGFGEKLSAVWTPESSGKYTLVATVDIGTEALIQKSINFEVRE